MCMAMNIIRDRHFNDRKNFKGKPQFLKFCHSCGRHGHSICRCPTNYRKKPFHKKSSLGTQSFHKHMTSNQDLPNKKAYTNNSTGKPLKEHYQQRYNRSYSRESNGNNRQNSGSRRNSPHPRGKFDKNNKHRKYSQSPNRQDNNSRPPDKHKKYDKNYNSQQSPKRNHYGSNYQKKQIHQVTTDEG